MLIRESTQYISTLIKYYRNPSQNSEEERRKNSLNAPNEAVQTCTNNLGLKAKNKKPVSN